MPQTDIVRPLNVNGGSVRSSVMMVGPAQALTWLKHNAKNRSFRRRQAERWADVMKRGGWVMNGEAIVLGASGRLLDGQHRLHAIVMADVTIPMMVTTGVTDEDRAFETLDSGVKRSHVDRLAGRGERYSVTLSGMLRCMNMYSLGMGTLNSQRPMEGDQMLHLLSLHPDLREFAPLGDRLKEACRFPAAPIAFTLYAASRAHYDETMEFYGQLLEGIGLTKSQPAYLLRARIIGNTGNTRLLPSILFALCIKAMNVHLTGNPISLLRHNPSQESFPEIVGFPPSRVMEGCAA